MASKKRKHINKVLNEDIFNELIKKDSGITEEPQHIQENMLDKRDPSGSADDSLSNELNEILNKTEDSISALTPPFQKDGLNKERAGLNSRSDKNEVKQINNDTEPVSVEEPVNLHAMLHEVIKIYQEALLNNEKAINYLNSKRLNNPENISRFKIGYCDGTLLNRLSKKQTEELKRHGILNDDEKEALINSITIPILNDQEALLSLYGLDIDTDKYIPIHFTDKIPIFNQKALRVYDEVILTDSVIEALELISKGVNYACAINDLDNLTVSHIDALHDAGVKTVIIADDNEKTAYGIKDVLVIEGFKVKIVETKKLKGLNADEVKKFIEERELFFPEGHESKDGSAGSPAKYELKKITAGYAFKFENGETYEVLNLKEDIQGPLKVILKIEAYGKFHCDDFNLYNFRQRENFTKQAEYLTGVPAERGTEHLKALIKALEEIRNKRQSADKEEKIEEELTDEEIITGMDFLTNPALIDELKKDLSLIGCVGEDNTKVLLYLVATSRLRSNPISVYVLGRSSGGKSYLVKSVLKLIPETGKYIITKISPEVIYYMKDGLKNKVVMVGEFDGAENIEYLLKELVSDGYVSKLVTLKDPETGLPRPEHVVSKGPISLISTSTKPEDIDPENLNRCILMHIDESALQTERILKYQRFISSKEGFLTRVKTDEIIKKHHIVQKLLEDVLVFNIFGDELDFPTLLLLARRAHFNFLHVIEMTAFILQKQHKIQEMEVKGEKVRYIETNIKDYEITYSLMMRGIMENTLDEMSVNAKNLHKIMLKQVEETAEEEGKTINTVYVDRQEVMIYSGWTAKQVRTAVKVMIDYGYLEVVAGKENGKRHKYRVLNVKGRVEELLNKIPKPVEMKKRLKEKGKI